MMAVLTSQGLPEGTMIDGWKVLRKLGAGGFGAVHQVEKNCRLYALKLALLPQGANDKAKTHERTLRELLCLLMLNHPNIIRVHGHGHYPDEAGGHLYLALEYIDGWTLAEWLERTHPTVLELLRVFEKLAGAVAYMHGRGVFHRDLKLLNVLIRKSDGEPILIDLGAAAFAQAPEVTEGGLHPTTLRGLAPEANRWWSLNRRKPKARYNFQVTDELFAFGVMLYDALTDPRPSQQRARTAVNSVLVPAKPPEERNPRVPAALASLVRRLLARDPAQRPESFEAVRRELAELLEHQGLEYRQPVHAPSTQVEGPAEELPVAEPPRGEEARARGWWRQRKGHLAGAVVGAAVLAGVAGLVWSRGRDLAPPPRAPGSIVSPPLEKEPDVKTPKNTQPSLMLEQVPRFANEKEFLAWCKAVGLGTFLAANAGCPGAQLRPEAPAECPSEAVQAMKEHGVWDPSFLTFTFGEFDGSSPPLRQGRVEAKKIGEVENSRKSNLPDGTRLFGELWTAPDFNGNAYLRFDRVRLPNGTEFPVCIVANDDGDIGVSYTPEPGVVKTGVHEEASVVFSWPPLDAPLKSKL